MNRIRVSMVATALVLALAVPQAGLAKEKPKAVSTPKTDLKWANAGVPGVSTAVVDGDMAKGPSHFYLKYAAGLVTPVHHHSPNHYVTTISGTLVVVLDGKEQALPPGSYFAFTGKAKHAARCDGSEDCVMFVDARGPWDVVPEKAAAAK